MGTSIKETLYEVKTFPVPLKTGSDHNPSSSGIEDKENKFAMGTSVKETLYEEKKTFAVPLKPNSDHTSLIAQCREDPFLVSTMFYQLVKYCHTKGNFNR